MELVIVLLMVVAVVLVVAYPLFRQTPEPEPEPVLAAVVVSPELYTARETTFEALRDLQFEYATGKLSADDYEKLKAHYEVQAASILQQIDAAAPKKAASSRQVCRRCNAGLGAHDKFCTHCGAKV